MNTTIAQQELNKLKDNVIGLYKENDTYSLVTATYTNSQVIKYTNSDLTFDCINITNFGIIQEEYNRPNRGILKLFPDNKNMIQMLESITDWYNFIMEF